MKHLKKGRKFGRVTNQRRALILGLARNLIRKERIETTESRAKEIRGVVEKMVTRAKKGTLANRRLLLAKIGEVEVKKLFSELAPRYKDRPGGYLRLLKFKTRQSDGAPVNIIEFVK